MHIDELRQMFGLSRRTIHDYVARGLIPPPSPRDGRNARYRPECVALIQAYRALKHNNTSLRDAIAVAKQDGITLVEYVHRREDAIRRHGLGVA